MWIQFLRYAKICISAKIGYMSAARETRRRLQTFRSQTRIGEDMGAKVLLSDLQEQIERGQVVVLVGAGVSIGATNENPLASWTGLLEDGANRCCEVALPRLTTDWKEIVLREVHSDDLDNLLSRYQGREKAWGT
jgi:hypothetical protein